jgi:CRISPR-associated endonuclease Cas1
MTLWLSFKRLFGQVPVPDLDLWPPPEDLGDAEEPGKELSPAAAPVHVLSGSALVRIDNGVLVVERQDQATVERPMELVSALHIHGWATITSPCVGQLVSQGTAVIWRGATGYPVATALPMHQAGVEARRAQYVRAESATALDIARAIVAAKIVNMRGLVRRRASLPGRDCLDALQQLGRRAHVAPTIDTLMGLEGTATARYFAAWPEMISARAGDLSLDKRTRRPPRDEVNAALSYAYAVLAGECLCTLVAAGLDPRLGFLHRPRAGRPSLAVDFMEPFRPLIADQAVLAGLNHGQFRSEHFSTAQHAIHLTEAGKRMLLGLIEQRLSATVTPAENSTPIAWREAIGLSAQALAKALRTGSAFMPLERP